MGLKGVGTCAQKGVAYCPMIIARVGMAGKLSAHSLQAVFTQILHFGHTTITVVSESRRSSQRNRTLMTRI